ncbi:hypothetical protein GKR71_00780 [Providencia sp. wls1922]|uniref:hypothetical protein n=1 Tax=Providencia sp. wls1922 TaxID=2675152 RepID=UPI0012B594DD|nr:hypothetical protein [Providencia sp. wls1922]MTC44375.1 hypothetical protein [Providencia sp. wls1922]
MKERGIIFNTEMVRAILDGRKTQTRCIAKFKPIDKALNLNYSGLRAGNYHAGVKDGLCVLRSTDGATWNDRTYPLACPYGKVGDRLWVRETFNGFWLDDDVIQEIKEGISSASELCDYKADYPDDSKPFEGWTPSTQMPRWASRIILEITDIRVERIRAASDDDFKAEGYPLDRELTGGSTDAFFWFRHLWDSVNKPDCSFESNPWVWVIEFKRV